ncbi:hypothetical protein V8D89_004748 [Ganoderma adspersum]
MYAFLTGLSALAACVQGAAAWGSLGHQTVGYVAQEFLAPKALAFVKKSLGSTYNETLGAAAPWADTVRHTKGYTWSAPFHFVDANDSPLDGSCSVDETRDCGDGKCILSAIANYTTRVAKTSLSAKQRQEALKFLDHAYEVGGNDIDAKCSGKSTNLHAAWDTGMVEKNIDENHDGAVETYATDLVKEIKTGSYKSKTKDWLSCTSTTEPVSKRFFLTKPPTIEDEVRSLLPVNEDESEAALERRVTITPLECPLEWAKESNAYCCSTVFSYTSGEDLCTSSYYAKAVPVIDLQLAKQAYRLAAWLNVIFDGDTNLP